MKTFPEWLAEIGMVSIYGVFFLIVMKIAGFETAIIIMLSIITGSIVNCNKEQKNGKK